MLNYIHWDVGPEIFRIGSLTVRWYGLLFALGFYFGYLIMQRFFKKEGISVNILDKLATYIIIATVIGARLGHVLFYEPGRYFSNPIEILKIWEGGLASHGAAIAIILAIYLFSRKHDLTFMWIVDRLVIVIALAGAMIRTGNLMNSEIFGEPTTLPWAFIFERVSSVPRHPTQIYEALSYLIIFFILFRYYYAKDGKPKEGLLFGLFLVMVFAARFLIEFIKEPQVAFEVGMALNLGQLLSIPFVLLGGYLIYRAKTIRP
ncbi:MAG: prolipoprotein diacylglyceryl transferase [Bacteroidales bacterium]|nr:prolipoprotein diacylglyceryl transferase [Bacteroidales bacterium]